MCTFQNVKNNSQSSGGNHHCTNYRTQAGEQAYNIYSCVCKQFRLPPPLYNKRGVAYYYWSPTQGKWDKTYIIYDANHWLYGVKTDNLSRQMVVKIFLKKLGRYFNHTHKCFKDKPPALEFIRNAGHLQAYSHWSVAMPLTHESRVTLKASY